MDNNLLKNRNRKIILELAMYLNKELLNEDRIDYKMYKLVEDMILKSLKD